MPIDEGIVGSVKPDGFGGHGLSVWSLVSFFTTKEGRSGVGLYISRQIVRKHGYELSVRSIEGKGTTVILGLEGIDR